MIKALPKLIIHTILTALCAASGVFLVTTAFDISVSAPLIGLFALFVSGLICCCFVEKKALMAVVPLLLAMLLFAILSGFMEPLMPTLKQFIHDLMVRVNTAYPQYALPVPPPPDPSATLSFTLLFAVVVGVLSIPLAWGVSRRSIPVVAAFSLPMLLLCVLVNDTPPSAIPLTFLLAVWVTVMISPIRPEDYPGIEASRIVLVLLASLIFLGTVALVYPKEPTNPDDLPEFVQEILDKLPGPVRQILVPNQGAAKMEDLGADSSDVLDLTTQGPRSRTDTVMMQLSTTEPGTLYLRAAAKDIYTGTTWESKDICKTSECEYSHTSIGLSFGQTHQAGVQIRNYLDASDAAFTPYGFISCTSADATVSDLRIPIHEDDYIIYYWPGLKTMDLTTAKGILNVNYDSYVSNVCLELPENTKETLKNMAISCGYDPNMDPLETVAWVAKFIRGIGSYELDVDYQPADKDFALYFLENSQEGYCVHYATAAAAMCRALGVPARYASGYRVSVEEAGEVTDVTDQDTHAWCEVYLSTIGWIPIETTPGFGESTALPEVDREVAPLEESTYVPEAPQQTFVPVPVPTPDPVTEAAQHAAEQAGEGVKKTMPIAAPSLFVAMILALILRRIILQQRRKRRFSLPNTNQAAIYMYHHLERLCKYGPEMPEDLEGIALKAKFSRHTITKEELDRFYYGLRDLNRTTEADLPFLRKLRFRWISCLHMK